MLTSSALRFPVGFFLLIVLGLMSHQAAAQFFQSPLEKPRGAPRVLDPGKLYSNLGERRPGDGPAWLNHGATDFRTNNRKKKIYSPDTGRVRFYGAQVQGHTARDAGLPPIKIGRFAMLHFGNAARINVDPRQLVRRRGIPAAARNWPVYVVEPTDPIFLAAGAQPTTLNRKTAKAGVKRNAQGQWEPVIYFNRTKPIAKTHGPDFHVLYYETKASDYGDRADIRNALSVFKYENANPPIIHGLWLFSQNLRQGQSKKLIAGSAPAPAPGVLDMTLDGGIDIVASASSFRMNNNNRAGIYQIAYQVDRFLGEEEPPKETIPGPGGRQMTPVIPETIMFTYSRMPTQGQDANLVATTPTYTIPGVVGNQLSQFQSVTGIKRTAYAVTNTNGNDGAHWALHNPQTFPDGDYLLTVKAWNIGQANGIGAAPTLRDVQVQVVVGVLTNGNLRRLSLSNP